MTMTMRHRQKDRGILSVYRKVRCKRPPHFCKICWPVHTDPMHCHPYCTEVHLTPLREDRFATVNYVHFPGFKISLDTSHELSRSDFTMMVVLFRKSKREFLPKKKVAKHRVLQEPNTLLTVFQAIISKSHNAQRQVVFF